jgi:nucleoside-diphosphate-sugar epimerase
MGRLGRMAGVVILPAGRHHGRVESGSDRVGTTVVVTDAGSALGTRVLAKLAADPTVERIVAVDAHLDVATRGGRVEEHRLELDDPDLKGVVDGADVIVHLGSGEAAGPDGLPGSSVAATRALLDAAASHGVAQLVVLSSAMVYGAWPGNPVPLTEEAPLRPDPGFGYGLARAEIERLSAQWRGDQRAAVAVLRSTVAVDAESESWLAVSPWSARACRTSGTSRASQFVHLDDLAGAIDHARRQQLDGVYNVAPDGWLPAEALADLAGPVGRLHLPPALALRLRALRERFGASHVAPERAYVDHDWVVANDRLRATGWEPGLRSEEVYVEADPGGPLAAMSPRRRQVLSLGALAGAVLAAVGGAAWLVLRRRGARR